MAALMAGFSLGHANGRHCFSPAYSPGSVIPPYNQKVRICAGRLQRPPAVPS